MNLATSYLGLTLENPFVVGASPFCDDVYVARKLQDLGAAAVTMRSLFEEQIDPPQARALPPAGEMAGDGADFPEAAEYQFTPDQYLRQVERLKSGLTIPVIASLNGRRAVDCVEFGRKLERAGADAIELNFYHVVTDPAIAADQVEAEMIATVDALAGAVRIPIAVKLSPFHASVAQLGVALELAGASGVVLFNRFYQPDINVDEVEVQPILRLSEPVELLLRLRWLAILSPLLRGSLAVSGGVHTSIDAVKALLAGAHAVQLVSVLLKYGPSVLGTLRHGLERWMVAHNYARLDDFRGLLNHQRCRDPATFERANYIRVLQRWKV